MSDKKTVTAEELREHSKKDNLWVLLHNKVYAVSKFIDEHPGGDEVILAEAGKDATEAFEDVGHSDEARDLLADMYVGDYEGGAAALKAAAAAATPTPSAHTIPTKVSEGPSVFAYLLPLGFLGAYLAYRYYN